MMEFIENLLEKIATNLYGKTTVMNEGVEIDFKAPYKKIGILDAIKEYAGVDVKGMDVDQLRETCKKLNVEIEPTMGVGKLIDAIFGEYCEKHFVQPTFVTDYPVEMSPLTKRHRNDPTLTERFELFVCGHELANAYSELNDPIDQRERFEEQAKLKSNGDDEAMFIDYDFLRALEYGMPPTSGLGMGIDRLTMLMTGNTTIQDVLFFPQMRPEKVVKRDGPERFVEALGTDEVASWVPLMNKAGINTLADLAAATAAKLQQDLCGLNKKHKLGLKPVSVDTVGAWIAAAAQ